MLKITNSLISSNKKHKNKVDKEKVEDKCRNQQTCRQIHNILLDTDK